ncbi:YggT family protein [Vannielia litorea]|uniref:YggT family protein n=1 Tax=Vannielia litorea TaxID=1217970 RepID=UPI001BCD8791|nr:YggT family protein [Vannielia litorea]MBS8227225.1 YggT family protein [Vannielia litorea]
MLMLYQLLDLVLGVVFFIMLAHVIMSWLITFQILNLRQPFVYQLWDGLNRLLEPVYRPIRRVLPDTGALDLAPLIAFVVVIALRNIILPGLFFG